MRCEGCGGNVTVDDAFSGSVCRCPYCKAIITVPPGLGSQDENLERPDAPPSQEEADSQIAQALPVEPVGTPSRVKSTHKARRKIALIAVMLILTLTLVAGLLYVLVIKPNAEANGKSNTVDDKKVDLLALDVKLVAPVIYCIDGGSTMYRPEGYDNAVEIVCKSIETLKSESKFNVLVFTERRCKQLGDDYLTSTDESPDSARQFLKQFKAEGSTIGSVQEGMAKAINMKPAMCVFFAAVHVEDTEEIIRLAKANNVQIITVSLDRYDDADESLTKIAEETGGQFKAFREED